MSNIAFLFLPLVFSSLPAVLPFVSPSSQVCFVLQNETNMNGSCRGTQSGSHPSGQKVSQRRHLQITYTCFLRTNDPHQNQTVKNPPTLPLVLRSPGGSFHVSSLIVLTLDGLFVLKYVPTCEPETSKGTQRDQKRGPTRFFTKRRLGCHERGSWALRPHALNLPVH